MYGLIHEEELEDITIAVCNCLGHGSNANATDLLLETAGAETGRGLVKDNTTLAGMGITQFDKLPFQDVKDRCSSEDKDKLIKFFNIDIELVEWEHLRYNPLLCMIFTRLKYKKIPEAIPTTLEGRANYWKQNYNSLAGKGSVEHYIKANSQ